MELKNQKVFLEIYKLLDEYKTKDPVCEEIVRDLLEEAYLEHNQNINRGIDKQLYKWIVRKVDETLKKEDNDENN